MQITLIPGEPLPAAIARFAADHQQNPASELRRMVPERVGAYAGFALPLHLAKVATQLPPKVGATPEWLAETFTGFPAIAPLLEQLEQEQLLESMIQGVRVGHFPICHGREMNAHKKRIRYCPVCVSRDRAELGFAALRMRHNIHGVSACSEHGCCLVEVEDGFGDSAVVRDADQMIGEVVADTMFAQPAEVQIAADIAELFVKGCPRPGRRRIASFLKQALIAQGYASDGVFDEKRMVADLEARFPEPLAAMYADPFPQQASSWRNCYAPSPRVYPIVKLAMLARLVGLSLVAVLQGAATCEPAPCAQPLPSSAVAKAQFPLRRGGRRAKDSMPRRLHRDWDRLDIELEDRVRLIARIYRAHVFRPCWISALTLAKAASAVGWRRPSLCKSKLPRFHAALVVEADTPFRFADRVLSWLLREIRAGNQPRSRGYKSFLDRAQLATLASKHPTVATAAQQAFIEQAALGEQLVLFDVTKCAPNMAA